MLLSSFFLIFCLPFSICSKDSSLVLQTTQSVLSTHLANLDTQPFMNVEVALRMLYLIGEAVTDKVQYSVDF